MSRRTEPVQSRAEALVDSIIDAVDTVILADGIDAVSTTSIAKAAGVSVGSIYRYFDDKTAVLEAYIERYRATLAEQASQFLENPPTLDDIETVNRVLVNRSADMLLRHPGFAEIRLWRRPDTGELLAKPIRDQETAMIRFLLNADPRFAPDEAELDRVVEMIIETSMTLLSRAPRNEPARSEYVADVITMMSEFVRAKADNTRRTDHNIGGTGTES